MNIDFYDCSSYNKVYFGLFRGKMKMEIQEKWIILIHKKALADPRVNGMMIYGSSLHSSNFRDIDIALFVTPPFSENQCYNLRLEYLKEVPEYFDLHIFNLLPVAIQHGVLQGKVIFAEDEMYDLVYHSIQEYEDFVKYREQYREAYLSAD